MIGPDDLPPQVLARAFTLIDHDIKMKEHATGSTVRIASVRAELIRGGKVRVLAIDASNFAHVAVVDV